MQNKLKDNSHLGEIFQLQDKLNARFGWSQQELLALPEDERLQRVRNFLEVLLVETGEALKASRARWWKKEKDWQGYEHLKEEIIDCFHFLASAFLAAGGTAEEFYEKYVAKNQFNHERKDWAINEQPTPKTNQGASDPAT